MKRSDFIKQAIATEYNITVAQLTGPSRVRWLVNARVAAMAVMKSEGITIARIAEAFDMTPHQIREHLNPERKAFRKQYRATKWREKRAELANA